jgi:hypothetical protein
VLAALMLNEVFGELDGTLIVAPNAGWMLLFESKLCKDLSKPQGFLTCITAARYSASADESAIACCFLQAQVTGPQPRLKT